MKKAAVTVGVTMTVTVTMTAVTANINRFYDCNFD